MSTAAMLTVLLALQVLSACSHDANGKTQAVLSALGTVTKDDIKEHRKGLIRRHDPQDGVFVELVEGQKLFGVADRRARARKVERGLVAAAPDGHSLYKISTTDKASYSAPDWEPHRYDMPAFPHCSKEVSQDMGISDYGRIAHTCVACDADCTEKNMQQATNLTWLFEPALDKCNIFNVSLYSNWSNIDKMDCEKCAGKGLRHKFEMSFASNAGEGLSEYMHKPAAFEGWMGPEVTGGVRTEGSDFVGRHVFEVLDTEEPPHSDNCEHPDPPARWLAIPGTLKQGETFSCERICVQGGCKCGRTTGMRCTANIAMSSNQVFGYSVHRTMKSKVGSFQGESHTGPEWEVTAEDLSQKSPVIVVGRVILAGNSDVYGISSLRQSHQHIGCVPCDLFYESTIVSGPFISEPPGIHVVRSADGNPPVLTEDSCELFRVSALGGTAVLFETGPGLWPPSEVNDTIFACTHKTASDAQCPTV